MMNKPFIDELVEAVDSDGNKVDSKYTLIAVAAKRARQITAEDPESSRSGAVNPVSQALKEIDEGDLLWHRRQNQTAE